MKKILFCILLLVINSVLYAQVGINSDNSQPDPSAMLDVKSTTKGTLLSRMTYQQRNAIAAPAEGLMVVCTNCTQSGTSAISVFLNGTWQILDNICAYPNRPVARTHVPDLTQITWKWNSVPIATGYKWNTTSDYYHAIDVGMDSSYTETGLNCYTSYTRYVWAYNSCGYDGANLTSLTAITTAPPFTAPTEGVHVPSSYQIVWNWSAVAGASGYKWNIVNDFNTAEDLGTSTTKTEGGVDCGSLFTRYVWAYSYFPSCGISPATTLTQLSANCPANCLPLTDARDGKTYKTVLIGTQCWMKENLNAGTKITGTLEQTNNSTMEKYCMNDEDANCDIYGGLYQWAEMVQYLNGATNTASWNPVPPGNVTGICPTGWHLPADAEWTTLTTYLGGTSLAGGKMKETFTTHWYSPNTGATNSSGFTALGSGFYSVGFYYNLRYSAYFCSSTEYSNTVGWYRYASYSNANLSRSNSYPKTSGFSVRCIKD